MPAIDEVGCEEKAALFAGIPQEAEEDRQQREYLESRGLRCPHCGGKNLESYSPPETPSDMTIEQTTVCLDCLMDWTDIYTLTGFTEL